MKEAGADLLCSSAGNPYFRLPNITRPFGLPVIGGETPPEHPLESVARLFDITRRVQEAEGDLPVIGSGYSWLRQFLPYAGVANLSDKTCSLIGFERESFAYPDALKDILDTGGMKPEKCCIACSKSCATTAAPAVSSRTARCMCLCTRRPATTRRNTYERICELSRPGDGAGQSGFSDP